MANYAGFGADEVKGDLLRALAILHVRRVLVFVDAICNTAFP
jgi:hypothetical protein